MTKRLSETNPKFIRKAPVFNDVKEKVVQDVADLWMKASLPIASLIRIETKLKELIKKFNLTRKRAKKIKKCNIFNENRLTNLFNICKCKCSMEENPSLKNKKLACSCDFEDRIPSKEIDFLKDQRTTRKMIMSSVDQTHLTSVLKRCSHKRKYYPEQSTENWLSSSLSSESSKYVIADKIRKKFRIQNLNLFSNLGDCKSDPDFEIKKVIGEKFYKKIHMFSVNQEMCILADHRMTSIRQHSDQLGSLRRDKIAASPTTIFANERKYE
ncbi:unnamed protein product [Clavelina lepadiformis]|uniref:Uncharacterized protein n=1 Tax=Clavelina lepadiformis TaxID=159417 RepID=A0ABP0FKV9_CLALP